MALARLQRRGALLGTQLRRVGRQVIENLLRGHARDPRLRVVARPDPAVLENPFRRARRVEPVADTGIAMADHTAKPTVRVDVLYADPLGLNGFLLAAITYVAWRFYERLRMYSVAQQCSVVFLLVVASEAVRMLVQDLVWDRGWTWAVAIPALTSTLLWPFVYLVLHRFRMQVRVE